ncbi:DeoR/GlpR family DNA-binding transcription regulator [Pokkaliibacter sp. CJK22405]|uniref:DeoR/GlpR family DNA-binding transcription regulator n=1 Tax=Pokkaliibacter sp. CJK22405 TaxID=3384615 RepID=UPI003984FF09
MTLSARQKKILDWLQQEGGTLSSNTLTDAFGVSAQTIRKDLNELSDQGLVKRVHGGITLPRNNRNLSFSNRQVLNLGAKQAIAQRLVSNLPEGSSLFLGIGTTPQQIAQALLDHPGLIVVTNNLNVALTLCQNPNIETLLAGGRVRPADQDIMGEDTTRFFRRFRINYGVFGVGGIGHDGTLVDFSPEESHLTHSIMENSEHRILVADASKYLRNAPVISSHLRDVDEFYTDLLPEGLASLCRELKLPVQECASVEA